MKDGLKFVVIGGGSSYTPELVDGLIRRRAELPLRELALVDVPAGEEKLTIIGGLTQRMLDRAGLATRVTLSLDRRQVLAGADFVITQFRVGGMSARAMDERIPLAYNVIGQETTGPGGFAKALRTIPVALDVAQDMQELCPAAWLINFTNPSGIVTEALLRHGGVRAIGLCNVPISIQRGIAARMGVEPERIYTEFVGLNHLSWARKITFDGRDITPKAIEALIEDGEGEARQALAKGAVMGHRGVGDGESGQRDLVAAEGGGGAVGPAKGMGPVNVPPRHWPPELLRSLGMVPSPYLRYYYFHQEMLAEELAAVAKGKGTRAEQVMAVERDLFQLYRQSELKEKPKLLEKRGGAWYSAVALSVINSIVNDLGENHIVDVRNGPTIPDLPPESVIEVNAVIDARGAHPLPVGPLPLSVRGLVQQVKTYEELTVQAAVHGDRQAAYLALLNHPLVPGALTAQGLLDEILEQGKGHLPQFRD